MLCQQLGEAMLELRNVTKLYRNGKGVRDISFQAEKGTIVGIVGMNGCGKSTLLNCITLGGFKGSIRYSFEDFTATRPTPRVLENLGVVHARYGFPAHFSAGIVNKILSGLYKNWSKDRFREITDDLGLETDLKVKAYSTGMRSKLAIAIAMAHSPRLMVFDETTKGLDKESVSKFKDMVRKRVGEGCLALMTSHAEDEIEELCDGIVELQEGRQTFCGTKADYFSRAGKN